LTGETLAFLYGAAGRWLTYLSVFALVGTAGFALFVRRAWRVYANDRAHSIERLIFRMGLAAALVLLGATVWRLYAQAYSVFGLDESVTWRHVRTIAFETVWGRRWLWQFWTAALAAVLLVSPSVKARFDAALTTTAAVAVLLVIPLTGHAVTRSGDFGFSIALQVLHIGGVGLWIGTLFVVLVFLRPAGHKAFGEAVRAFSPLALGAVATLAATGLLTSIVYLESVSELWSGIYGRTLVLKMSLFAVVGGIGAYNWRRLKPVLDQLGSASRLTRTARVELLIAALTLVVTSALVGLPLGAE
jgi:putative copper export protein